MACLLARDQEQPEHDACKRGQANSLNANSRLRSAPPAARCSAGQHESAQLEAVRHTIGVSTQQYRKHSSHNGRYRRHHSHAPDGQGAIQGGDAKRSDEAGEGSPPQRRAGESVPR